VDGTFVREHGLAASLHCDVRVVHLLREPNARGLYAIERLDDGGLPVRRVRYRRFPRPLSYLAFLLGALAAARELGRDGFRPDVVHAHSFLSAVPSLVYARLRRLPVVYTEHWTIFTDENPGRLSRLHDRLANAVIGRVDLVLPVSQDLADALARRAHARFEVVDNVVDTGLFTPPASRSTGARLLTVGLMTNGRKGVDYLLKAVARVHEERPDVELDVVGDGGLRPGYERLAGELGIADCVRFHGYRDKPAIAQLMREADLFTLGSRFENSPCVVIEAMASGLPVVATRVGGVPELVTDAVGVLAEPQDAESLAAAIETALGRLDGYDREAMVRTAKERFSRETVGARLTEIYGRLARARR
jgi:glycosyltransferase involved in cell wall biosynthesis